MNDETKRATAKIFPKGAILQVRKFK